MTDFIAYMDDKPISVYEYKDLYDKDKSIKKTKEIICICGRPVIFVNESCFFQTKRSKNIIQRSCHFSHLKGEKGCAITKITTPLRITASTASYTETEKRIARIDIILDIYIHSMRKYASIREKTYDCFRKIKNNNLDINLDELFLKIKDNFYIPISIKELEYKEIDPQKRYKIIEIDVWAQKCERIFIFSSTYKHMTDDYEHFKCYVKKLSMIIQYYSRCIKYDYIDLKIQELNKKVDDMINEKRLIS